MIKRKKTEPRARWVRFSDSNGSVCDAVCRSDRIREHHLTKALRSGGGRIL